MDNLFLGIITLVVLVCGCFAVYVLVQLKKTLNSFQQLIDTTENTLKPTIEELQVTMRSVRKITDGIGTVTDDVQALTGSLRTVGENVRYVSDYVSSVALSSSSHTSGLLEGLKAGFGYFLGNMLARNREND